MMKMAMLFKFQGRGPLSRKWKTHCCLDSKFTERFVILYSALAFASK